MCGSIGSVVVTHVLAYDSGVAMERALVSGPFLLLLMGGLLFASTTACETRDEVQAIPSTVMPSTEIPVTTSSESARAAFLDGRYALEAGDNQKALEFFRLAVGEDPDFTYAYLHMADVPFSPEAFERSVRKAVETSADKSEGERLLAQIRQTYLTNDADRRAKLAADLADAYPSSGHAWLERGIVHTSRDEHVEARDAWLKVIDLSPRLIGPYVQLSTSYIFEEPRDANLALQAALAAVEIAPEEGILHVWLGDAYRAQDDLERARGSYEQAVALDASYAPAYVKLGHVQSFLGDYAGARASYDTGIARGQGVAKAQLANYRAFVALHEGDPAAAYRELDEVIAMIDATELPDEQKTGVMLFTLTNQFTLAAHSEMLDEAAVTLDRRRAVVQEIGARAQDANMKANMETDALFWDGYLAVMQNRLDDARQAAADYYQRVKDQTSPQRFERQHQLLGLAALMEGDGTAAVEHLSQADLSDIGVRFHLAMALEAAGEVDDARALFDDVARHNFNSVEYALVRATAIEKRRS
jgi:Flp pilus assembly protein TadD